MTNREWLESLSDEEFVKEISKSRCERCFLTTKQCLKETAISCNRARVMWLSAEHKDKEVNGS